MVRKIVRYPAKILKEPTLKVDNIDDRIRSVVNDMIDTLKKEEGVGLAANQIGEPLSIMVIDTTHREGEEGFKDVLINPTLLGAEGEIVYEEGCLSFPGLFVEVKRARKVGVSYIDLEGREREREFEDFLAVVFQHEYDHLNGITFVDRLKGLKRRMALEKYQKILREAEYQEV